MLKRFRKERVPNPSRFTYPIANFLGIDAKTEQSGLPISYAAYAYNVAFKDGNLVAGMGVDNPEFLDSNGVARTLPNTAITANFFKQSWLYRRYDYQLNKRDDRIIVQSITNKIFVCNLKGGEFVDVSSQIDIPGGSKLTCLNYHLNGEDVFLIYLSSGGMYVYDGSSFTEFVDTPKVLSACLHYERAWAIEYKGSNRLYFSAALSPTDFTVDNTLGGYISFPDDGGELLRVISFKDYIYVIREFAIHRLIAYTDPRDYKLTRVFTSNNKIYANTVTATNDNILFYAEDGFYAFDGFNARKVYENITPLIDSMDNAATCFFNHKFYFSFKVKNLDNSSVGDEGQSYINNCIIAIDQKTQSVDIMRGVDVRGFLPVNQENICDIYLSFNNFRGCYFGRLTDDGKLYGAPLKKLWQSPYTSLNNIDRYKILRWLFIS